MRFDVLEQAWREDDNSAWREHVTAYIQRNPDLFHIYGVVIGVWTNTTERTAIGSLKSTEK